MGDVVLVILPSYHSLLSSLQSPSFAQMQHTHVINIKEYWYWVSCSMDILPTQKEFLVKISKQYKSKNEFLKNQTRPNCLDCPWSLLHLHSLLFPYFLFLCRIRIVPIFWPPRKVKSFIFRPCSRYALQCPGCSPKLFPFLIFTLVLYTLLWAGDQSTT